MKSYESLGRDIVESLSAGKVPSGNSHVEDAIKRRISQLEGQRDAARITALIRLAEAFEHWDGSKTWPFNPGLFWRPNRHIRAARLLRHWASNIPQRQNQ